MCIRDRFQNEPPGHHVILFYTLDKQPPGTQRICTDSDMASFRYLAGSGTNGEVNEAPGSLVFRIPKGAQVVVNHHYLNATDNVMRGQSVVNINYADPGNYTPAGNTAFLDSTIQVPPGESSYEHSCTIDRTMKLWYLIPHMHQWGKHITVDVTRSGETERMFDLEWDDSFTFHPPELKLDPAEPMVVNPGDKVTVH